MGEEIRVRINKLEMCFTKKMLDGCALAKKGKRNREPAEHKKFCPIPSLSTPPAANAQHARAAVSPGLETPLPACKKHTLLIAVLFITGPP